MPVPGRSDAENDILFLDRLEIIALAQSARDDRRLARRGHDLNRDKVVQLIFAGFVHRVKGVVKFVPLDIDAALPRAFQLGKDTLGFRDLRRFAFHLDPAFASRDFHTERFLEVFDQLQVIGVKRLDGPRILKLQRARFSHLAAGTSSAARIRLCREECQTCRVRQSSTTTWREAALSLPRVLGLLEAVNQRPVRALFG